MGWSFDALRFVVPFVEHLLMFWVLVKKYIFGSIYLGG
jgi:hypothetical protein